MSAPTALAVDLDRIPAELRALDRWVVWSWRQRDGRWTKPPFQTNGDNAKSTDPATWTTFAQATAALDRFDGIGLALTPDDDLVAVDLDHCVDDGAVADWAQTIVDQLDSYTEVSPSGTGLRVLVRGKLPPAGRRRGHVEMYEDGRYVTLTGATIGDRTTVEARQSALVAVHGEHVARVERDTAATPPSITPALSDFEVIDRARNARNGDKFLSLYNGAGDDASAADLAFVSLLAFWTQDGAQLDRLFRGSPRMRDKWDARHSSDGRTYGQLTIGTALDGVRETYTPTEQVDLSGLVETGEIVRPEVVAPDRFFGKQGLLHASLRVAVLDEGPIATGSDRKLWHYSRGVWLPNGADEVRRRCRHLLGQRWRKSHVEGVVADLEANPPFITDDQPERWVNCRNGLLDWRNGELHDHDPAVPSTYQLAVDWNPAATCPTVDAWLEQVVPDDAIELVWEVIGTAVFADQPFHRAVLLLGPGRNGKGTLLRLVSALIGHRHISAVTLQALGESRFAAASLFGKVANIAGDLDARAIARTDLFKMATGGDLIEAEHKYGAAFRFRNRATFLFSANEPPGSVDHTDGFFARWCVIPFTRLQLAPGAENPAIEDEMHAELEGVLVKAVDGLRRAMKRGTYDRPASVIEATEGYRTNADPLRRFIDDQIEVTGDPNDTETRSVVYAAYRQWCMDNGHRPLAANKFWGRLVAVDPAIDPNGPKIGGTRYAQGIRLDTEPDVLVPVVGQQGAAPTTPPRTYGGKSRSAAPSAPDPPCPACLFGRIGQDGRCTDDACAGL